MRPPLGSLGATYDVHLRLIGKHVVNFLLMLIDLFRHVLRPRHYKRISIENQRFCSNRVSMTPKFQVDGVAPHRPFFCQKTRMNGVSCGIRMRAHVSFVLSQSTRLTDDAQRDRQTERLWQYRGLHYMQSHGKNPEDTMGFDPPNFVPRVLNCFVFERNQFDHSLASLALFHVGSRSRCGWTS